MAGKTRIHDFVFQYHGEGKWRVTYISPGTGRQWSNVIDDMELINATKFCEKPKRIHLNTLKNIVKNG